MADSLAESVAALGLREGLVVQELGWDEDVDDGLRVQIENVLASEMTEDAMEAVDVVVLWWREDDGDIVDGVVDALTDLTDDGVIWLLTPKVGREGHVDPADLQEAARTAGMALTSTVSVASQDWTASKLVRPKGARK